MGNTAWVVSASGKGKHIHGIAFAQGPRHTWWVMREDREVQCVPQGDLIPGENSQCFELYHVNFYIILYGITTMAAIGHISVVIVRINQISEELNFATLNKV